jgi:hypothetical protein
VGRLARRTTEAGARRTVARHTAAHVDPIVRLQRSAGNRAVVRMLARQQSEAERMDELMMSVQHERDPDMSSMRNHLIDLYEQVATQAPESYVGNLYSAVLPASTTQSNYTAAAGYTARDPVNNRVRWALQHTLLLYALRHAHAEMVSRAEGSTEFSYQIHRASFSFANDVSTIRHLPWMLLTRIDVPALGQSMGSVLYSPEAFIAGLEAGFTRIAMDPMDSAGAEAAFQGAYARTMAQSNTLGGRLINWTIETTNSPHGYFAPPWYGVTLRTVLDALSFVSYPLYD